MEGNRSFKVGAKRTSEFFRFKLAKLAFKDMELFPSFSRSACTNHFSLPDSARSY